MSRSTTQSLCLIAAMKSGLVTVVQDYEISTQMRESIERADKKLTNALKVWEEHKNDNQRALAMLGAWSQDLKEAGLDSENNLTVMVAMSQQACSDLLEKLRNKEKIAIIYEVLDELDELGGYLQEGIKDKVLIPKFILADEILGRLYKIIGFSLE